MDLGSRRDDQIQHSNRIDPDILLGSLGIDNYHADGDIITLTGEDWRKVTENLGWHIYPGVTEYEMCGWKWQKG